MQTIQRLPNGTIDYDHYRRAAAALRSDARTRAVAATVRRIAALVTVAMAGVKALAAGRMSARRAG
jgi:hypothetical protein